MFSALTRRSRFSALLIACVALIATTTLAEPPMPGEALAPADYGPGVIESMAFVQLRDDARHGALDSNPSDRQGQQGEWVVPGPGVDNHPQSGQKYVVNKWGDTRMSISFPEFTSVAGAFFSGHGDPSVWSEGLQAIGYAEGVEIARSSWLENLSAVPTWLSMDFAGVDRIEIVARPVVNGAGWYGMDDLTFTTQEGDGETPTVLDFEDLPFKFVLTDSSYFNLVWEHGTGDFGAGDALPPPGIPPGWSEPAVPGTGEQPRVGAGTLPQLERTFQGVIRGDAGSFSYPPDTMGAVGPNHYVITVNRNFAVYERETGAELINVLLGSFLPGSNGDPRVIFDQYSQRWFVIVSDFSSRIYLAASRSADPTGDWFKTSFLTSTGADAGRFPDYPTLGVDANGVYTSAYMAGGYSMTIFAIDKAPLIAPSPSLGTVTAFRGFPFEGAIQPVHTYGATAGEYFISRSGGFTLTLRRVLPPLSAPTIQTLGTIAVPGHGTAPDAPALGSSIPLDTVDTRLMNAVFRDGRIWTTHTINVDGRAACRWYEVDPGLLALVQYGTISDPVLHYFFPTIMVNLNGHVGMGFSGSSAQQFAGAYFTGRQSSDPPGEMALPVQYRAGLAPQNNIDGYGRNRWGDYSATTLDPVLQQQVWTIQEYAEAQDIWGTYVAVLGFDCNENGVDDVVDVTSGTSADCNANFLPDECEPNDDCNLNGIQDICDVAAGTSQDCDSNKVPDECQSQADCDANGIQDICDIAVGTYPDCNGNQVPDACDLAAGAPDCNDNLIPDSCESSEDCNRNGVQDICDLASGASLDCNANGRPDECDIFDCGSSSGACQPTAGDCCAIEGNGSPGCNCGACCQSICAADPFCCQVEWDFICADSASRSQSCPCGSALQTSFDCNLNGIPDECDLSAGSSLDCNDNQIPDECDPVSDCNANGVQDICDVAAGTSGDCNGNEVPDECEAQDDCNGNGVQDICDLAAGNATDCNLNEVLDECDIASATSDDCNTNGLPDECESQADCNSNGIQDICDVAAGASPDCNGNNVPDECDIYDCGSYAGACLPDAGDCCAEEGNGTPGCNCPLCCQAVCGVFPSCCTVSWDSFCALIASAIGGECDCGGLGQSHSRDCNGNVIPDECDIASGFSVDCNNNGVPDDCDPDLDCNSNGSQDICDVAQGTSLDCNGDEVPDECQIDCNANGVPDDCDVRDETSLDCNGNGVPDECDSQLDCNDNGIRDICDVATGASLDCNSNEVPDECDSDCDDNGIPDECEIVLETTVATDLCRDAQLACPGYLYSGSTSVAGHDGEASCGFSEYAPDVWYRYQPADSGFLKASLCGSRFDTVVSVHDRCPGTLLSEIGCNDDACGLQSEVTVPVTGGRPYWIRISGYGSERGLFDMRLTGPSCILSAPDCNENGSPDACDLDAGTSFDCNGNNRPDECDGLTFTVSSEAFAPFGGGYPAEFVVPGPPPASDNVIVQIETSADLGETQEYLDVTLNGTNIGRLFQATGANCPPTPRTAQIPLVATQFNSVLAGENSLVLRAVANSLVSTTECPSSYLRFYVTIPTTGDCNGNGYYDDCDVAEGRSSDCNANRILDECEIARGAEQDCSANGTPDSCEPDCNANAVADSCDVLAGVSQDCDGNIVPDECQPDGDGDGVIDACDPCPNDYLDDQDDDGFCDSDEECPTDPTKHSAGVCGCGVPDIDSDGDDVADCIDRCPGVNDARLGADCSGAIPAVSMWGMVILLLTIMAGSKIAFRGEESRPA
ncbi:MAG: hypothetical protein J5J06_06470 [Phycisphaerae bacterium]|nr:hypothetical protein [Phycisphaerae bacterium]